MNLPDKIFNHQEYKEHKSTTELRLLLWFLYVALAPNFIRLIGNVALRDAPIIDAFITYSPFILTILWILVKFTPGKKSLRQNARIKPPILFFLWGAFGIVIVFSIQLGITNQNPFISDSFAIITLFVMPIIAFFSIQQLEDVRWLMHQLLPVLLIFTLIRLITTFLTLMGLSVIFYARWEDGLLIAMGFCWTFVHYLLSEQSRNYLILLLVFGFGLLIGFEKPIVGSFCVCLILTLVIIRFTGAKMRISGKLAKIGLITFMIALTSYSISDIVINHPLTEIYLPLFQTRYLKQSLGRLDEPLDGGRLDIWADSVDLFEKQPWIGYGVGVVILRPPPSYYVAIHNTFFYSLIAWGAIGSFFFFGAFVTWLRIIFKGLQHRENLPICLSLFSYTILIIVFGLLGTMWGPSVMSFFGITVGILLKLCRSVPISKTYKPDLSEVI